MKKFFAIIISFLVFSSTALADTTFDDKPICEEQKGVWREYGNGCVDECYPKFDKFTICTSAITLGCDCGKGRCFDNKKCVPIASYKKDFDKKFDAEQKVLQEEKKKRQAEYQANSNQIVDKLISEKQSTPITEAAGALKNNYNDFYQNSVAPTIDGARNAADSAITAANKNLDKAGMDQLPQIGLPNEIIPAEAPPIQMDSSNASVPALFLEQQNSKQPVVPQNSGAQQNGATNNASTLPIIPLPN